MSRLRPLALVLALALVALGLETGSAQQPPTAPLGAPQGSPDLSGTWNVAGWNMGVDPKAEPSYRGTVTVERHEKDTYLVTWHIGARANPGVGLFDPRTGVFATGYSIGGTSGVAIYTVAPDHELMECVGTFQGHIGDTAHEAWRRE